VKNDVRDAEDLADLLRLGRLAEAWIAPKEVRELREIVRYRAKLVCLRSFHRGGEGGRPQREPRLWSVGGLQSRLLPTTKRQASLRQVTDAELVASR
jgi:hypothetical protein